MRQGLQSCHYVPRQHADVLNVIKTSAPFQIGKGQNEARKNMGFTVRGWQVADIDRMETLFKDEELSMKGRKNEGK